MCDVNNEVANDKVVAVMVVEWWWGGGNDNGSEGDFFMTR